jgi:hypothetical protein
MNVTGQSAGKIRQSLVPVKIDGQSRQAPFILRLRNIAERTPAQRPSTFAKCRHDAGDSKTAATNAATTLLPFAFLLLPFYFFLAQLLPEPCSFAIKASAP